MSSTGVCPSCGNVLTFRVATSTVVVCEFCRSIVVRGGAELALVGKSNEILATGSVLALGVEGTMGKRKFTLVGRTQLKHDLGGTWDEWYIAFADKPDFAWLAEHQGRFALMAEVNPAQAPFVKSPADVKPGQGFTTSIGQLVVVERGEATIATESGELPSRSLLGARRPFIDFATRDGRVATLDFGATLVDGTRDKRRFFLGRELTLAQLGLAAAALQPVVLGRAEGAQGLKCPHCGAPVERKMTESESLTCSSCASVLSVENDGRLGFMFAQEKLPHKPWIPVGTTARIDAGFVKRARAAGATQRPWPMSLEVEVVANVVRSVVVDGTRYFFQETLLRTDKDGFFWLVESDGAWLFVRNLDPGAVVEGGGYAKLEGRTFNFEQRAVARVEQVLGELYFRVTKGETSTLTDYKSAPRTLSKEESPNELIWTECLAVDRGDVERVFRVTTPRPPSFNDVSEWSPSSSSSSSGSGTQLSAGAVIAIVILVVFFIALAGMCDSGGGGGGGGGHYGGGNSSSGYSFGK